MTTEHLLKAEIEKAAAGAATNGNGNGSGSGQSEELTVVAAGDSLEGRLTMKGNGRLLGTFAGEVDCEGELLVGPDASVSANIRTRNIVVSGLVRGNIVAAGRLKITSSGRLEGDARVGSLIVQEGGVHHGAIRVHPEGVPADEEPVAKTAPAVVAAVESLPRVQLQASVDRVKKFWGEFF